MTSPMPRAFFALTALVAAFLFATPVSATSCPSVVWSQAQLVTGYSSYVENFETIDYDHDGKLDLVGSIRDNSANSMLYSWRGVGNGTFEAAVSLGTTDITDLEIANVNNDAYLDIIGGSYGGQVWVRMGNATGFNAPIYTYVGYAPYDVHAVNLDGDSYPDLLVSSFTSNIFVLYHGVGNGSFTELQRQDAGAVSFDVDGSVLADFDGDTRLDVAVARRSSESVAVYFRNVDSSFAAPVVMSTGVFPRNVQSADFNEDGLPDLVSTNWQDGTIDVFRNLGGRAFSPRLVLPGAPPRQHGGLDPFRLLDVNGDAHIDIVAGGVNGDWIVTYLGVGDGTFTSGSWYPTPSFVLAIATGDFDGDTDIDLAVGSYEQHFTLLNTCATQVNLYSISPVITSGQTASLRALISGISSATPLPRGTVTFKEGAATLGTDNVDVTGLASLDVPGLALGDHTITAEFSGNTVLAAATSASMVQKVTTDTTTTTILFPPAASVYGTPYTFNVEIRRQNNFTVLDYYLLTVDGVESERYNGAAITLNLTAGQHTISAKYLGNSFYPPSESGPQIINTAKATRPRARAATRPFASAPRTTSRSPSPVRTARRRPAPCN